MQMPPPHTQYVDSGVPMMPTVGPYGMVQMMPANPYMMQQGMMAGGYPPRYSYPGNPNDAYDEKARLLADDADVNAKKGKKKGMVSAAGGGGGGGDDDDNVSDPGDGDDRREEQMQKATNENNASTSKERLARVLASFKPQNVADFSKMFDPLALLIMWLFNMLIVGIGSWQLATLFNAPTVAAFKFDSPLRGNPYLLIAILWCAAGACSCYVHAKPYLSCRACSQYTRVCELPGVCPHAHCVLRSQGSEQQCGTLHVPVLLFQQRPLLPHADQVPALHLLAVHVGRRLHPVVHDPQRGAAGHALRRVAAKLLPQPGAIHARRHAPPETQVPAWFTYQRREPTMVRFT
jgi:hypothetical protein